MLCLVQTKQHRWQAPQYLARNRFGHDGGLQDPCFEDFNFTRLDSEEKGPARARTCFRPIPGLTFIVAQATVGSQMDMVAGRWRLGIAPITFRWFKTSTNLLLPMEVPKPDVSFLSVSPLVMLFGWPSCPRQRLLYTIVVTMPINIRTCPPSTTHFVCVHGYLRKALSRPPVLPST
jgi:hypothetical protein